MIGECVSVHPDGYDRPWLWYLIEIRDTVTVWESGTHLVGVRNHNQSII